jgi:hypothetical protein
MATIHEVVEIYASPRRVWEALSDVGASRRGIVAIKKSIDDA